MTVQRTVTVRRRAVLSGAVAGAVTGAARQMGELAGALLRP
jgi:hypothetical protein